MTFRKRVARWISSHRLHWAMLTVIIFGAAVPVLIITAPNVSNLTLAIISVAGTFTAAMTSLAELLTDD